MKTKASKFNLALAPTGRARCRKCKSVIGKGDLRIVVTCFVKRGMSRRVSRCVWCLDGRLAKAVIGACGDACALPVAAGVDHETAEALKARLVALADTASGQRVSAGDGEGGKRAISRDGSMRGGCHDESKVGETCHSRRDVGAKTLGK